MKISASCANDISSTKKTSDLLEFFQCARVVTLVGKNLKLALRTSNIQEEERATSGTLKLNYNF